MVVKKYGFRNPHSHSSRATLVNFEIRNTFFGAINFGFKILRPVPLFAVAARLRQIRTVLLRLQHFLFFGRFRILPLRSEYPDRLHFTFGRRQLVFLALRYDVGAGFARRGEQLGQIRLFRTFVRTFLATFSRTFGRQLRHVHIRLILHYINRLNDSFTHGRAVHGRMGSRFEVGVQCRLFLEYIQILNDGITNYSYNCTEEVKLFQG